MAFRVLICRSNPIDPDPRVEKTARALNDHGYSVTLLGWDRTAQLPSHVQEGGINIFRLPIRAEFGHGMGNLPNLLRWQWGLLRWLIKHRRQYDIIHACDFDTILPALISKALWRKRVIYDIFDFYADHLRATPQWIKNIIRWIDLRAINRADALILVDDSRQEQVRDAKPKRLSIIYNSPEDILIPTDTTPIKDNATLLMIAYVGLLQVERGLFEMFAALKNHPEWSLDLAGFGGDQETITSQAEEMPNVEWYGRIPYERALQLSQAADVLFATYDPSIANHRYSSPNKIFEAMMLGKPIIVARHTNMDLIVEDTNCGVVIEYGDELALEASLSQLQNDLELRHRLGANARQAYEKIYGWPQMAARLLDLYLEVAGDPQHNG